MNKIPANQAGESKKETNRGLERAKCSNDMDIMVVFCAILDHV